jgi:hypothetical protein
MAKSPIAAPEDAQVNLLHNIDRAKKLRYNFLCLAYKDNYEISMLYLDFVFLKLTTS